ncbi:MAG TPA: PepSY-associated TM helix domain-containing protein [Cyclobacteriaceae bacterium]
MKKIIGKLHLWLGLTSGLVVFIISITGCIYVFEEELTSWLYKDREVIAIPTHATKKPLSSLLKIAQAAAGENHPIQNIEIPKEADRTYTFRPVQVLDKKAYTHFGEVVYQHKFYLNPYTGVVVKNEDSKYGFFTIVLRLHRNLLLNRSIGLIIVGVSVCIFVIMLITGIVLWWPQNKMAIRQRLSFTWKSTTQWKRKNFDLHTILGFYSSLIVLIIALTGLTWAFDWFDNSVQWLVNVGAKTMKHHPIYSDTTHITSATLIDQILHDLETKNPEAHTFTINLPEKPKGVINASARSGIHVRYATRRYQYDQFTGALLKISTFDKKNNGEKLKAMNYDIHVGSILGLPGKMLAFVAALISASLPVTGFYIWYGRRFKKGAPHQREKKTASGATTKSTRKRVKTNVESLSSSMETITD